jgi:hypothetical protein
VGVPQVLVRNEVLGGKYVTNVVGAVPVMLVAGELVAVPPVIASVAPAPEAPGSTQVVEYVSTVGAELLSTDAFS